MRIVFLVAWIIFLLGLALVMGYLRVPSWVLWMAMIVATIWFFRSPRKSR